MDKGLLHLKALLEMGEMFYDPLMGVLDRLQLHFMERESLLRGCCTVCLHQMGQLAQDTGKIKPLREWP